MSPDELDDLPPTALPFEVPATLAHPPSAARLRMHVLPALWRAWTTAAGAGVAASNEPDDLRARRLAAFDAAVAAFAQEARVQGATVTAIVRLLTILARAAEDEEEGESEAARARRGGGRDALRDRAGRVAMAAYYRPGT